MMRFEPSIQACRLYPGLKVMRGDLAAISYFLTQATGLRGFKPRWYDGAVTCGDAPDYVLGRLYRDEGESV